MGVAHYKNLLRPLQESTQADLMIGQKVKFWTRSMVGEGSVTKLLGDEVWVRHSRLGEVIKIPRRNLL